MVRGRVHRRNLRDFSDELRERRAQERAASSAEPRRSSTRLAERVLRRRRAAEHQRARVAFALILEQRNQPRRFADRDGKHARRLRIERSEMTGGDLSIAAIDRVDAAHARDGVRRSRTRRFKDIDESDHVAARRTSEMLETLCDQAPPRRATNRVASSDAVVVKPDARK